MRNFYLPRHVLAFLLLLTSIEVFAQSTQVTGRVIASDDGSGLPGVSILEKGTTNGTVTDANGNYSMKAASNGVLVFSFVGYSTQEIAVGGKSTVDVTLQPDVTALSEVVVVGYGQQEKKDVTGSLTNVSSKDFNRGVLTNPQDLIVGRVAGVTVTPGDGAPGSGAQIRVRGGSSLNASNDPLIVIDGFPVDNRTIGGSSNALASINPNDIESFTVLKDASATAIYGLRASNGVIIITTKKGSKGKPVVQYNGTVSLSTLAKKVEVMDGDEYRQYINQKVQDGSVSGLGASALNRLGTENTDWQDKIYEDAISQDHNLSVSGTFKDVLPYRISYGYTDQNGILKNTGFNRNSVNVSLTPTLLNDRLKVTASLKSSFAKYNFGASGAVGAAVAFDPTQPVYNDNTKYGGYFTWTELSADQNGVMSPDGPPTLIATSNPVALIEQTDNRSNVDRHIGNLQLEYAFHFLPELKLNVNGGFDITKSDGQNIQPNNAAFTFRGGPGYWNKYTGDNKSKLLDVYLNYAKNIGDHRVDATVGHSYQSFSRDGSNFQGNGSGKIVVGADTDDDGEPDAPLENIKNPTDLVSIFGRVNYSFKDKYLVTASLRNDYTSRFGEEYRSGLFPAFSLGWRISDETFMKSVSAVSDLKLRAGYGVTGQQDVSDDPYPYLPRYESSTSTANYQFGNQFYSTYRPKPYDAAIKWEETSTLNIGLDYGFFDNIFTGAVEVFRRTTTNLIGNIPIAPGSNFSNYLTTNVGDMEINGYEISLNVNPIRKGDFNWNFGVNFTSIDREITNLTKTNDPTFTIPTGGINGGVGNNIQLQAVGYAPGTFYTFTQIYDQTGRPIEGLYVDNTGMGGSVISNEKNKRLYKDPYADYLIGLNTSLTYKGFDFAFSGRLSLNNYVYNNVLSSSAVNSQLFNQSGFFSNVPKKIADTNFNSQQLFSDFYLENASFFKMDNIGVGYTLDNLLNNKLKARFSFTAQNAFIITKYSGIDPEHADGIDKNIYPRPRTFLFGINLTY